MKVLFVCTGNTCRSPMAEGYFNSLIRQAGTAWLTCASAGICAYPEKPPSQQAVEVMKRNRIDIALHQSSPLTDDLAESADLIVTMTQSHKSAADSRFPGLSRKIKTLSEYGNNLNGDIADPFGGTVATYEECFSEMKKPLENLFLELLQNHKKTT